jgi:hypothetical protein
MELLLAKSLAGHDRGEIYLVLGTDGDDVILVNGKNRSMERPKRKRCRHIQPIRHFAKELQEAAASVECWNDENVRKMIRQYLGGEQIVKSRRD